MCGCWEARDTKQYTTALPALHKSLFPKRQGLLLLAQPSQLGTLLLHLIASTDSSITLP